MRFFTNVDESEADWSSFVQDETSFRLTAGCDPGDDGAVLSASDAAATCEKTGGDDVLAAEAAAVSVDLVTGFDA